jgi:DNA-binding MarR family transcriptional regulator
MKESIFEAFVKAGAPKRPGDIAKELGLDSKEVSKHIDALKKEGRLVSPKRCFYAPA